MTAVFSHPVPGDSVMGYQLSDVTSLPPQPVSFLPAPLPVMPPPQGTMYFQPPFLLHNGLPQPVFCEQPNVPPLLENTSREGLTNDNVGTTQEAAAEAPSNTVFYPPLSFPVPFPPPVQSFPMFSPYIRPSPVFFILPPFADASTPSNSLPPLPPPLPSNCPKSVLQSLPTSFASTPYQGRSITNATSQSPTIRITPRKDNILLTDANHTSFKFSGGGDCRNFQRDNANRSELMCRNRLGSSLNNYRTKLCINFKNGYCPYGDKCRFIHQQTSDGVMRTKFSTNAPVFVPRANAVHPKSSSPCASLDVIPPNRLYSSTPVSLLAKGHSSSLDVKERPITPTGRRVSYRNDFTAGYRRPSVADGPHSVPTSLGSFTLRVLHQTYKNLILSLDLFYSFYEIHIFVHYNSNVTVDGSSISILLKYIDPNHAINKNVKKKAVQVINALGLDPSIELNEHELRIATQFVHYGQGADWSDIGGCGAVIEEINDRIIIPLKIRNVYKKFALSSNLLSPPKGVLLYGPPGCGKTLLAKIIAREANARFINLQVSSLCDKWYGESQKLADAVFSVAQKFQPTIIFIDEIDSFLRDRNTQDHEATAMMKAQFMCLWDGFASSDDAIVVLGATNRPSDVDSAILRRMPARFYVPLPSLESRADILKVLLRDQPVISDISFERIAEYATELSGSDLKEVCRNNESTRMIRESDLIQSVIKYKQTMQVSGAVPVFEPLD
ncbi:Mitochondrial sorting [Dirofilaria immitis]